MIDPVAVPTASRRASDKVRVWDPLVRLFHWALVAVFAIAWLTADEVQQVHELAGYSVAALVAFRLVWGFAGSHYARFSQFVTGPRQVLSYLGSLLRGSERRYLGHNPAGAAMILALLVTLSGTALTGWLMAKPSRLSMLPDLTLVVGPALSDDDGNDDWEGGDGSLKEVHESLANLMLLLVGLHVGGVVLASVRHRENLARAKLTGDKRTPAPEDIA